MSPQEMVNGASLLVVVLSIILCLGSIFGYGLLFSLLVV